MVNISERIKIAREKIDSIEFDTHWFRRVFHTFGASFLFYYMLPNVDWINLLKFLVPIFLIIFVIILEYLRISGKISGDHFFGLRMYEKKRVSSYLYFGFGIFILLIFGFPQWIAIPCILCASIADPIMGETRHRFGEKYAYVIGFLVCMIFFIVGCYKADLMVVLIVSIIGSVGAVLGETKKIRWLDDDLTIQIVPAVLLLIIWFCLLQLGMELPGPIIYPGVMPW